MKLNKAALLVALIIGGMLSFEIFNYSTTEYALRDLFGAVTFVGIPWSIILAIAFCSIDFGALGRIFIGEEIQGAWYLFGAWCMAAAGNALMTWWAVLILLLNHDSLGNAAFGADQLIKIVPPFVAVMVWLTRVLLIGNIIGLGNLKWLKSSPAIGKIMGSRTVLIPSEHKLKPAPQSVSGTTTKKDTPQHRS